ncbi:MAG: hypothetical protein EAZ78_07845 [Oscillatoriales cyanobacterium]|uniref:Uncharacterized protein n=1 Tax=Microcoleus anatoxicus PTRS2 TaxID=2705321 RepID=A0ABU8YHA3_9CYAN|nr:MAG: hypothetical protein EA000_10745 [Oscillatoriales cyanobacterium]TAD98207.1 MAG: hypothetical protein EAZ98_07270 [Oscillatoriales cyanobacterium]TAE05672.1 MAG: hypothetical protein EAZ96_04635 [Oscillatoriales cyanobacterium]TAF04744.1 MAG: hypothetical protein EAZ78_07845 [Oscillatoriales cyanobacterium]TAF47883.1 MAG: hypothetical protein EAZ68_00890 [Oscillatoriales cyanobacterium]
MLGPESRNSEIITNIKTVKAFATETGELKKQTTRLDGELKVVISNPLTSELLFLSSLSLCQECSSQV